MKRNTRKNVLDRESLEAIFYRLREQPDTRSQRVNDILDLLCSLRRGMPNREKMQIHARLRQMLSAYLWTADLSIAGGVLHPVYRIAVTEKLTDAERWEHESVRDILAAMPDLPVRRCAVCNEWLYASRSDQQFCSGRCRQKHYDANPAQRAQKRKYMRGLRALHARKAFR